MDADDHPMEPRLIRLRYRARCARCERHLSPEERGWWDANTRLVWCELCGRPAAEDAPSLDTSASAPGASARAEHQRRRRRDEARTLADHPRVGRLLVALRSERSSTRAWATGAEAEEGVGARLDALASIGAVVLHDRRVPGTRANIDHIVVAPSGVWVIDTKHYRGLVMRRDVGGWFRRDERLYVGGRDRTKLVAGMRRQVAVVHEALALAEVTVRPALCFYDAERSMFAKPFEIGDVLVTWPGPLVDAIERAVRTKLDVASAAANISARLRAAR